MAKRKRCTAFTKAGLQCTRKVVTGEATCRQHGDQQAASTRKAVRKGLPPRRYKRMSADVNNRIDKALQDPQLLDVRRPIALGQVIIEEATLVPEDEVIVASVRRRKLRAIGGAEFADLAALDEWLEPTQGEIEVERLRYLDESMKLLERFAKRQSEAAKNIEVGRLLNEQAVPMLAEMGTRVARLIDRYVSTEHKAPFMAAFRQECVLIVQEITAMSDK
jgi:hypothetical protein